MRTGACACTHKQGVLSGEVCTEHALLASGSQYSHRDTSADAILECIRLTPTKEEDRQALEGGEVTQWGKGASASRSPPALTS
jgi:hypothetical protein